MDGRQCPRCGTINGAARSLCENCQSPLTAYSGQLQGEEYEGKLADQVERLAARPAAVYAMAAYLAFVALGWPLRFVLLAFMAQAHLNQENTNYLASAFGAIAPILASIVFLPIAIFLLWIAWSAYTQQPRAWMLSLISVGLFAAYTAIRFTEQKVWAAVWIVLSVVVAATWTRPSVKAWFGLS
jgi:hypothetical protein